MSGFGTPILQRNPNFPLEVSMNPQPPKHLWMDERKCAEIHFSLRLMQLFCLFFIIVVGICLFFELRIFISYTKGCSYVLWMWYMAKICIDVLQLVYHLIEFKYALGDDKVLMSKDELQFSQTLKQRKFGEVPKSFSNCRTIVAVLGFAVIIWGFFLYNLDISTECLPMLSTLKFVQSLFVMAFFIALLAPCLLLIFGNLNAAKTDSIDY